MIKFLTFILISCASFANANAQSVYSASRSVFDTDPVIGVKSMAMPVTGELALILNDK